MARSPASSASTDSNDMALAPENDFAAQVPAATPRTRSQGQRSAAPARATRQFDPEKYGLRTDVKRNTTSETDSFFVPPHLIPQGWVVQWMNVTILGAPEKPEVIIRHLENGWQPAPAEIFQEMLPPGYTDAHIIRGGQMLYMRPAHLSEQSYMEERKEARNVREMQERRLGLSPQGTIPRTMARIDKSYERMEIPEDDRNGGMPSQVQ